MTQYNPQDYIYDNLKLVKHISNFPQTYKTLLTPEFAKNGTFGTILRRKLNVLLEDGLVHKTIIPGTRFGEVIFYTSDKEYYIVVINDRIQTLVYCFFNYTTLSKFYILVEKYYVLDGYIWVEKNEQKQMFRGDMLKWI